MCILAMSTLRVIVNCRYKSHFHNLLERAIGQQASDVPLEAAANAMERTPKAR